MINVRYAFRTGILLMQEAQGWKNKVSFLCYIASKIKHRVFRKSQPQTISEIRFKNAKLCFQALAGELSSYIEVFVDRVYEQHPAFIAKEDDTVLDVGANIGTYTISQAKRAKRGRVFAFEPNPFVFERLLKNIKLNGLENVVCLNKALGSVTGRRNFYFHPRMSGIGSFTKLPNHTSVVEVSVDTLDSILQQYNIHKVDLIKIDVEGAEYEVLKGGLKALDLARGVVLECHSPELASEVRSIFESSGFNLILSRDLGESSMGRLSVCYYLKEL